MNSIIVKFFEKVIYGFGFGFGMTIAYVIVPKK